MRHTKVKLLIAALLLTLNVSAQIPKDKQLHMLAGFGIGSITTTISVYEDHSFLKAFFLSSAVSMTAGVAKELYDKDRGYEFDYRDLACTFAGGFWGYWATVALMHDDKHPFKYRITSDIGKDQKQLGVIINF